MISLMMVAVGGMRGGLDGEVDRGKRRVGWTCPGARLRQVRKQAKVLAMRDNSA